jgi:hypothetical protein
MNRVAETKRVGWLDGFFDCQPCEDCPENIISMADVEDRYPVTYVQGKSIVVHMEDRDVVFARRNKMYVTDFSDWIVDDEAQLQEMYTGLSLMTTEDRERMYTRKQVCKALEAGEFLRVLGYPTEKEAINFVKDGNANNIPHSVDNVKRFFDIYGPQVSSIRGKMVKMHVNRSGREDTEAQIQELKNQELAMDVMHAAGEKFLVSVTSPLKLTLICHLKSQNQEDLGTAVQSHLTTIRSRGFEPTKIYVDPHKTFTTLANAYPGVAVDVSRAGDHLDKADSKICRIKEMMRCAISDLPYKLDKSRFKDLATYVVSRINLRRTLVLTDNVAPRVKITGVIGDYHKEYGLSFGDHAEVYAPKAQKESNNVLVPRTEPYIALYPTANRNGSWIFFNLNTRAYAWRTQWKKLPVNSLVIRTMNELAGEEIVMTAEIEVKEGRGNNSEEARNTLYPSHTPVDNPGTGMTSEEAKLDYLDEDMPDLVDNHEDDSE